MTHNHLQIEICAGVHRDTGQFTTYVLAHINGQEIVMLAANARDREHAVALATRLNDACDIFLNTMQEVDRECGEGSVILTSSHEMAAPGETLPNKPRMMEIMSPGQKE